MKSTLPNMVIVLTAVAVITGGVLAWVNHVTTGPIAEQTTKQLSEGIKEVMGNDQLVVASTDTVSLQGDDGDTHQYVVHSANSQDSKPLGSAVESSVMGFGGELKVLVGFDPNGTVLGYRILQSQETPGLGQKAATWFQKGGKGCIVGRTLSASQPLAVGKGKDDVDAITASTITSKAFVRSVNNAYVAYERLLRQQQDGGADASTGASAHTHHDGATGASAQQSSHPASDGGTAASQHQGDDSHAGH